MFPCFREKPVFSTRDAPIDKRNLLLLSGRAVFRCRHKGLQEKQVPADRKSKLSKAKLYKSNVVKKITECNYLFAFFVIPVYFHYFTFCFKLHFPIADIITNHLYILLLRSRKTNTKCYTKKRKKSVTTNTVSPKKYRFLIFIRLDLVVLENFAQM